jgi:hypothetical protein
MDRKSGMESILELAVGWLAQSPNKRRIRNPTFLLTLIYVVVWHSLNEAERYAGSKKRKPSKVKKAIPPLIKALKDKNNLDAIIQAAFLRPIPEALQILEYAEHTGV